MEFVPSKAAADRPGKLEKRQTVKYATAGGAFQGASTVPPMRKLFCQKSFRTAAGMQDAGCGWQGKNS
jgi:hypothetical protein